MSNDGMSSSTSNRVPSLGLSEEKWPLVLTNPSKEGVVKIDGLDISKKYPGESIDGWTVSVSLKSDIETKDVVPDSSGPYFNAAALRLNPPGDLMKDALNSDSKTFNAHESWKIMVHRITLQTDGNRTALANDDGSCSTVLSEECVKAWEASPGKNWTSTPAITRTVPRECKLSLSAVGMPVAGRYENWSDSIADDAAKDIDWYKGSELVSVGSRPSLEGDEALLERISTQWDMIFIIWGYDDEKLDEGDERPSPRAKLVCTQALLKSGDGKNETSEGEKDTSEGQNGTNGAQRSGVSMMGLVPAAFAAFLLG